MKSPPVELGSFCAIAVPVLNKKRGARQSPPQPIVGEAWRSWANGASVDRGRLGVDRLVDEGVGGLVLGARDRAHGPAIELAERRPGARVKRPQIGAFHPVLARELPRDELGVVDDRD